MKRWLVISSVVAAAALAVVAAASSRTDKKTASKVTGSVTLVQAGGADFGSEDVSYFAQLMKQHGLKVNYSYIGDASSAERALISGQADVLVNAPADEVLAVSNAGAKIHMIAANNQASDYILLGLPGKTLKNLDGATLGIDTPGSAGEVAALLALKKAGVDTSQIHPVTIGNSGARTTAILNGRIDLAPVHYGSALAALATGKVIETLDIGKTIGPYLQSSLWGNDNFLKNTALAQEVVNDFVLAQRWAASNKYRYVALAQHDDATNGLTSQQMLKVWDYYQQDNYFGINGGICPKYIAQTDQLNVFANAIPKNFAPPGKWVNRTFVNNFLKQHHQKANTC